MNESLPCPFCGHVGLDFAEGSTFRWVVASCGGCGASRGEKRIQTLGQGTKEEWMADAKADAIAEWNTRASQSAPSPVEDKDCALAIDNILCSVLPGVYYMDPPDGGDITPLEQVQRMAQDAARYRWLRTYPNNLDARAYGPTFNGNFGGGLLRRDEFLDAAIDSARALAQEGAKE